ncbi:helix-turn-helix domain-containing protein [Acidovorax citrulli]|nr:helix-turn-helix domain-containing protein [Paracidovorax citrulli]
MNSPIKPTMDLQETADTLKMHPHSVEKLIRRGDLPAGKAGRAYLLLTRDVLAYAEKIVIEQTAERPEPPTYQSAFDRSEARRFA